MVSRESFFSSTIGRKQVMAAAGLGLCLFVLGHVSGNFLLFVGPEAYNQYGHKLTSNPLIYVVEAGLIGIFLFHAVAGLLVTIRNRSARVGSYAKPGTGDKKTGLNTKTLWWQGVVILGFVVLHLLTFKFGTHYEVTYGAETIRDLYKLVYEVFQSPVYVVGYVICVLILAIHLSHGLKSSLQTLGFHHERYEKTLRCVSSVYGWFVGLGFAAQPVYMMFIATA
jgi:succinate dehydrogenase / fumarate reductase, cytochrome b subunit